MTYSPSDLLLFSPRVYYRLFELHNRALWPLQIVAVALGVAALYAAWHRTPYAGRVVSLVFGTAWLCVAWSFLWVRYAAINWPVAYVAPTFAAEGVALLLLGAARNGLEFREARGVLAWCSLTLAVAAILGYPLLAPLMGRPWVGAEVFGIAPDPTAAATLALLAFLRRGGGWLMIVPALWCALSSGILYLLGTADFFVPIAGAVTAIALVITVERTGDETPS